MRPVLILSSLAINRQGFILGDGIHERKQMGQGRTYEKMLVVRFELELERVSGTVVAVEWVSEKLVPAST
jgi:hypothetical protein